MGLALHCRHVPRQIVAQPCSTCKQPIHEKPDPEATTDVNINGAEKYVVCPTCNKVVPTELRTAAYKSVWTRKNRERFKQLQLNQDTDTKAASVNSDVKRSDRCQITVEEWMRDRLAFESRIKKSEQET